ncbi:MAG: ATP-binding cassette domain-containing protein [Rikenellaceae bacterium]|nr:ATP-binding cassette domain-containing protein [Rikenellaceae bacterium]
MHDNTNIKLRGAYIATPMSGSRRRVILRNADLDVSEGELIYLIGKVGSGKSSLLKTLYGEAPLARGRGMVAGFRLDGLVKSDIPMLRRKLGMVFQDFQLLQDRTVYQNMSFVLRATGWRDPEHIRHRIEETLDTIGLRHKMGSMPHQLSGGEQQRVAVGRAFLNRPAVILADEPTGNLDPESATEVMELFIKLASRGCSILLATHNVSLIEQYPARIVRINGGTLEEVDHAAVFGTTATETSVSSYTPGPQTFSAPQMFIQPQQTVPEPSYRPAIAMQEQQPAPVPMFVQGERFVADTQAAYSPIASSQTACYNDPRNRFGEHDEYTAQPLFPGARHDFFTPASEASESYPDNGNDLWSGEEKIGGDYI